MKKYLAIFLVLLLCILTFPSNTYSAGPAGVDSGLKLWFSANSGVKDSGGDNASNGEAVVTWEDQSADNRDATR